MARDHKARIVFLLLLNIIFQQLANGKAPAVWIKVSGRGLELDRDKRYTVKDLEECKQKCLDEKLLTCRSFDYFPASKECFVSSDTRNSPPPTNFVFRSDVDYYELLHHGTPAVWIKLSGMSLTDDEEAGYFVQDLEKCKQKCLDEKSLTCRSFDYITYDRICMVSSDTRHTLPPSSFVSRPTVDYYELLYVDPICPEIDDLQDGIVTQTCELVGCTASCDATYSCSPGYQGGNQFRRTWSVPYPHCVPVQDPNCQEIGDMKNSTIIQACRLDGCTASFSCVQGYQLIGNTHLECKYINKYWSGPVPTCQAVQAKFCQNLSNPRYGVLTQPCQDVGCTATVTCFTGYKLVGLNQISCLSNGSWSDSVPNCSPEKVTQMHIMWGIIALLTTTILLGVIGILIKRRNSITKQKGSENDMVQIVKGDEESHASKAVIRKNMPLPELPNEYDVSTDGYVLPFAIEDQNVDLEYSYAYGLTLFSGTQQNGME